MFAGTGENVHLAVRDGVEVLYVDKVYGRRAVPIVSRTGGRLPMHPTGVGKALLAHEPDWFVHSYLARELERPTPHTIAGPRTQRWMSPPTHASHSPHGAMGSTATGVPSGSVPANS